jgi:hypothetical protein
VAKHPQREDEAAWENSGVKKAAILSCVTRWKRRDASFSALALSERDSLRALDVLENPPPPNARLLAATNRLPKST